MTTLAERERDAATPAAPQCEAIWEIFGLQGPCGRPAIGMFRRICVHEHVRDGLLCQDHAEIPEHGLCGDCYELPGGLAHDCPIATARITPGGAS